MPTALINRRAAGIVFGIVIALSALPCRGDGDDSAPASTTPPSALVKTAPVSEQRVAKTLHVYGVLDADPDAVLSVSLPRAGIIGRISVRLGQRVRKGDALLEVATAPDARMQYLQARSAVDFASHELTRQQRLLGEQLATHAQVEAAQKNLADARATLDALRQRGQNLENQTLRAPRAGIVTRLDVSPGQRVPADTTALQIAAQQRLIARLGIEPEDLGAVAAGTAVTVTPVFVPGVSIRTSVRSVHAMIDPATHLVDVLAPIPASASAGLMLGSRVTGTFQLQAHTALVVPRSAVLADADGAYVFVIDNGKARRVAVTAGIDTGSVIAVAGRDKGALQAGDDVVTSGNYELEDGMAVRVAH